MSDLLHEEGWEQRLRVGLGEAPRADFKASCAPMPTPP